MSISMAKVRPEKYFAVPNEVAVINSSYIATRYQ
jgi:hypothetical protein